MHVGEHLLGEEIAMELDEELLSFIQQWEEETRSGSTNRNSLSDDVTYKHGAAVAVGDGNHKKSKMFFQRRNSHQESQAEKIHFLWIYSPILLIMMSCIDLLCCLLPLGPSSIPDRLVSNGWEWVIMWVRALWVWMRMMVFGVSPCHWGYTKFKATIALVWDNCLYCCG